MEIDHTNFRVIFAHAKAQMDISPDILEKMAMVEAFTDQEIFGSSQEVGLVHDPSALTDFNEVISKVVDQAGRDQITALFQATATSHVKETIEVPEWKPNRDFQVPPFDPGRFEVPPWQPPTLFGEKYQEQRPGVSVTDYHPKPRASRE